MKNRNGSALLDIIIILSLISGIVISLFVTKTRQTNEELGCQIKSPIDGQTYNVTAFDAEASVVIAMPYKVCKDGWVNTDRRVLLKVRNPCVLSNGVWFTETKKFNEVIISSPIPIIKQPYVGPL